MSSAASNPAFTCTCKSLDRNGTGLLWKNPFGFDPCRLDTRCDEPVSEEEHQSHLAPFKVGQMLVGQPNRRELCAVIKELDPLVTDEKERAEWRTQVARFWAFIFFIAPECRWTDPYYSRAVEMITLIFPATHPKFKEAQAIFNNVKPVTPPAIAVGHTALLDPDLYVLEQEFRRLGALKKELHEHLSKVQSEMDQVQSKMAKAKANTK